MTRWLLILLAALGGLALLGIAAGRLGLLAGSPPPDLGVREGKLKAPSTRPNSVSSQTALWPGHPRAAYAQIAPLALVGGDGPATLAKLRQLVDSTPGARVVLAEGDYLRCEFSTPLMRYTDDVEFWLDRQAGVVQLRSASRLGYSDRGANRARIEALRVRLAGG